MALREDCRLLGHAWFEIPSDWNPRAGGNPMSFRCERCGTERREVWGTNTGDLVSRNYIYIEGYQYMKEDPRPTREQMRLQWLAEHMTEAFKRRRQYARQ